MNRYGVMAQKHWATWRPAELRAMEDPESFFSTLGLQIATEIDVVSDQIAGQDLPGETTLQTLGRLRMARFDAESDVLRSFLDVPVTEDDEEADRLPPVEPLVSAEEIEAWQAEAEAEMAAETGPRSS